MFSSFNSNKDQRKNPSYVPKQIKLKLEYWHSCFDQKSFLKFRSLLFIKRQGLVSVKKNNTVHPTLLSNQFLLATITILFSLKKCFRSSTLDNSWDYSSNDYPPWEQKLGRSFFISALILLRDCRIFHNSMLLSNIAVTSYFY